MILSGSQELFHSNGRLNPAFQSSNTTTMKTNHHHSHNHQHHYDLVVIILYSTVLLLHQLLLVQCRKSSNPHPLAHYSSSLHRSSALHLSGQLLEPVPTGGGSISPLWSGARAFRRQGVSLLFSEESQASRGRTQDPGPIPRLITPLTWRRWLGGRCRPGNLLLRRSGTRRRRPLTRLTSPRPGQ